MLTQIKKHANANPVSAGNKATASIPATGNLHTIYLRVLDGSSAPTSVANMKSQLGDINVSVDGTDVWKGDATIALILQEIYGAKNGANNVAGIIPITFVRRENPLNEESTLFALGLAEARNVDIEIDVVATTNIGSIEVFSEKDYATVRGLGQHVRLNKFSRNFASTGEEEVDSLPLEGRDKAYLAIHFDEGSGQIDEMTCEVDNIKVFDQASDELLQVQQEGAGRTPQSGYKSMDFALANNLLGGGMLPMANVKDFRQKLTWNTGAGAPGSYSVYTEVLHGLKVK